MKYVLVAGNFERFDYGGVSLALPADPYTFVGTNCVIRIICYSESPRRPGRERPRLGPPPPNLCEVMGGLRRFGS